MKRFLSYVNLYSEPQAKKCMCASENVCLLSLLQKSCKIRHMKFQIDSSYPGVLYRLLFVLENAGKPWGAASKSYNPLTADVIYTLPLTCPRGSITYHL